MRVTCDACRGHKKIMGLGMVETECEKCEGAGRIDDSELAVIEPKISIEHSLTPETMAEEVFEPQAFKSPTQSKKLKHV